MPCRLLRMNPIWHSTVALGFQRALRALQLSAGLFVRLFVALFVGLAGASAQAATPALPASAASATVVPLSTVSLQGNTTEGKPFDLRAQQGKVVLVVFWSTDCAVCRDKLPELRENRAGWRKQPFDIVLVSTDRRLEDLQGYQSLAERLLHPEQRMPTLWRGDPGFRSNLPLPTRLPAAWLVDKQGRLVEAWEGRIPPQAWDRISELL